MVNLAIFISFELCVYDIQNNAVKIFAEHMKHWLMPLQHLMILL